MPVTNPARPTTPFAGTIGRTLAESVPDWPSPEQPDPSTPNIIFIVLDDVGYADLGCFGSDIPTPHIDRLAAGGLRYTNFHATPLCSPTRAALLTGRNHHSVGMRLLSNLDTGFPSGRGFVTPAAATLAEMLVDTGFNTMCVGKWHLAPTEHLTQAGPYDQWPLGRGFERYYGFLEAETDCFYPELTADNHHVDAPGRPEDGYHLTDDLVDRAIGFVRDQTSITPDKPFFLHLAFAAAHAPHQAPPAFLHAVRGRYDQGWDVVRRQRFEQQRSMGIIPPDTVLPASNPMVEPWDDLSDDQRRLFARMQEAYAAMLIHVDQAIGRFIDQLEHLGRLDNSVIMLLSDNGASQEGGVEGTLNPAAYQNREVDTFVSKLAHIDDIGGPTAHSNYPLGWAQAGNTPFRRYKQNTHEGGVRTPLIVHWPASITDAGGIRQQFHHVTDLTPTALGLVGVTPPSVRRGINQMPLHGADLSYSFAAPRAPTTHPTQYFEMFGHRGIQLGRWKAVAFHERDTDRYDDDEWELYDTEADWSESTDLAAIHPEILARLVDLFWSEAARYDVLPLDDQGFALRARVPRPGSIRNRERFVYYRGMAHIPAAAAPPTMNRSHRISTVLHEFSAHHQGVIVALGGPSTGYVMYVKDRHLCFDYNYLGELYRLRSSTPLPTDRAELTVAFEFVKTGDCQGVGQLLIDGDMVARGSFPRVIRYFLGWEGLDVGRDGCAPVSDAYDGEFPFTGTFDAVTFDLAPSEDDFDLRATQFEAVD